MLDFFGAIVSYCEVFVLYIKNIIDSLITFLVMMGSYSNVTGTIITHVPGIIGGSALSVAFIATVKLIAGR